LNKYSGDRKEIVNKVTTEAFFYPFSKLNELGTQDDIDDFDIANARHITWI
jgi:hypothetical protein